MPASSRLTGMRAFFLVWMGQLVSLLGTSMPTFGLTIWAYERTGRATDLALISVFYTVPQLVMSPLAGMLVDRYDRKWLMMLSDLASGLVTVLIFGLFAAGRLEIWHLFFTLAVHGAFQAFQWPAYSAAIASMLPKDQYTRANSLMELAGPSSQIFAPLLAGALLGLIGLRGIMIVDIVTFSAALAALLAIRVPAPVSSVEGRASRGGFWAEISFGFRYIFQRPSLLGVQGLFLVANFVGGVAFTLLAPMILARTGNDRLILGSVQTAGALGGVIGGRAIGAWGGFRRRLHGVVVGWVVGFLGTALVGVGRPEPGWAGLPIWIAGMFVGSLVTPLINGSNQAIWQAKVPQDIQGRVFSARIVVAWFVIPIASLIAGPLADQVMEPAMQPGGGLAEAFGWLVGTGREPGWA